MELDDYYNDLGSNNEQDIEILINLYNGNHLSKEELKRAKYIITLLNKEVSKSR